MYKFIRSKCMVLLFALVAVSAISGLGRVSTFADVTKTDPSISASFTTIVNNTGSTTTGTAAPLAGGITIALDDSSDLVNGSSVVLEAPSGTRFTLGTTVRAWGKEQQRYL